MAKVVAQIKIFPTETTVDLGELRKKIEKALPPETTIARFDEEPIAFGLVALVARVVMPEEEGRMDKVEEALKSVENVSEIQVVNVWRT
ncbi:elongation factor 1-beta [Candidatus Bathyarchaeota archaeon]|nr:elongation factor 1-beta [Candidatus Bathyarchaeota archaeon]